MSTPETRTIKIRHCDFEAKVKVGGNGPPVLYLHTAGGPLWDPFVDALARRFTVYAPDHPGTGETARDSIHAVRTLWDLVLIYDELIDALGLRAVPIVGASFGGMVGCEVAAHRPDRVSKLVLLDPIGLWRDDKPVAPYMLMPPDQLAATLFHDTTAEPVRRFLQMPEDPKALAVAMADSVWSLGATGKFVWPIPDKGLSRRMHRITARALIIWGEQDALIPAAYAKEFADRIANAQVKIIPGAGHVPQWERLEAVEALVTDFLSA
ncbi:MAG TPA: alpha/beta fold hydrolase [Acetobacteraceae bacterium]|nr:alpha/beta fold hydrolase [Acetobacteraceae bacterium]